MSQSDSRKPRPARAEALPRRRRLKTRAEFRTTYEEGRRLGGRLAVVFARRSESEGRLGVTATRKVGVAVVRNRARRRVREIYRRWRADEPRGARVDVVVNVTARGAATPYALLREELCALLSRAADAFAGHA